MRPAKVILKSTVLSTDDSWGNPNKSGQRLGLIPRHGTMTTSKLGDEACTDIQHVCEFRLRLTRPQNSFCDGLAFRGLGVGGSRHVAMLLIASVTSHQQRYLHL